MEAIRFSVDNLPMFEIDHERVSCTPALAVQWSAIRQRKHQATYVWSRRWLTETNVLAVSSASFESTSSSLSIGCSSSSRRFKTFPALISRWRTLQSRYRRRVTDWRVKDCQETVCCELTFKQIVTCAKDFSRGFDVHEWSTPVCFY